MRRVEPAVVGLHVRADPEAPSSARLGSRHFGTAVLFDPRGWAVRGYVVMDAVRLEARRAGFRLGDRLVGVNGVPIRSQEEFDAALWRGRAGEVVRIAVERDGATLIVAVASEDRYRFLRVPPP